MYSPDKIVSLLPSKRHDQVKHPSGKNPSLTLFLIKVSQTLFNNFTPVGPYLEWVQVQGKVESDR